VPKSTLLIEFLLRICNHLTFLLIRLRDFRGCVYLQLNSASVHLTAVHLRDAALRLGILLEIDIAEPNLYPFGGNDFEAVLLKKGLQVLIAANNRRKIRDLHRDELFPLLVRQC
jgi:hypothetical protein